MKIGPRAIGPAAIVAAGAAIAIGLPHVVELFTLVDVAVYCILAIAALSLAFVWGYGGILSFGQSAFFGLGGYAYALAVINLGESTVPLLLGIVVPMLFAALLGSFMIYGRISDVYLAVITLTVSLIINKLLDGTSGPEYVIGKARLGGHNGIPGLPPINWPGDSGAQLDYAETFQLALGALVLVYLGLRLLLASEFGRALVAIRENELRAELLGYDSRRYKLIAFVIGAGIAGLAGVLFASWGSFIGPSVFGIAFAAQIIIWLLVGGLGTLGGAVIGTVLIQYLTTWLGQTKSLPAALGLSKIDPSLVLGAVLILFVLLVPSGLLPTAQKLLRRRGHGAP
ncbi:MAG: branched-chain amino acid ABC transporter permease [Rhodospirillaceae bacterium]|nr:branched-chain amino acid ABC transporter permease [Rhodospirillaceae bacterium]